MQLATTNFARCTAFPSITARSMKVPKPEAVFYLCVSHSLFDVAVILFFFRPHRNPPRICTGEVHETTTNQVLGPAFGRTDFSRIFILEPPDFFADFLAGLFLLILWEEVPRNILQENPRENPPKLIQQNPPTHFCRLPRATGGFRIRYVSFFSSCSVAGKGRRSPRQAWGGGSVRIDKRVGGARGQGEGERGLASWTRHLRKNHVFWNHLELEQNSRRAPDYSSNLCPPRI